MTTFTLTEVSDNKKEKLHDFSWYIYISYNINKYLYTEYPDKLPIFSEMYLY